MKNFFSTPLGKRLVVGLLIITLAVGLGIAMDGRFTGPDSLMIHRMIFIVCVIGLGLGGFLYIFLNWWGLLGSEIFVLVLALPQALPDPWNRYFSFLYLASLLGLPPLIGWLKKRKKVTTPAPEITIPVPDEAEGWQPFALIYNSIVVLNELSGRVYQLVFKNGRLYGYWIGGELKGIDETKLQTKTPRFPTPAPQFVLSRSEIRSIKERSYRDTVAFTLRGKGHTYLFVPYGISTEEEIYDFFQRLSPDVFPKKAAEIPASQRQKSRRVTLYRLRVGLLIAIGVINLPWLFLNVPYKLFAALALLPFPISLAISCLFPDDVSLDDRKKKNNRKVDFLDPLLFSCIGPALRVFMDFNFLTWKPLLIQAGLLLLLVAVLLLVFNQELRKRIGYSLCIVLLCSMFCLGAIGQLNLLLDSSQPQQQVATITDMHISTSTKSPDRYYLTVVTVEGAELDLMTSKEHYDSLQIGENVTVYIKEGGLGIPYAIAD